MEWLRRVFNPMKALKEQLAKASENFTWSRREIDALLAKGYDLDQITLSENMIRAAGGSWIERQIK